MIKQDPTLETLTEDQRQTLEKLRSSVSHLLQPKHNDHYLLRWLIARNFDLAKAQKMLEDHFKWRKEWDVDNILAWKTPEVLKTDPRGMIGFDKEGSPVTIFVHGACDIHGILRSCTREEMIKFNIKTYEGMEILMEEQSKKLGRNVSQQVIIMDMENTKLSDIFNKEFSDIVKYVTKMTEDHFPESVKTNYIINAPSFFTIAFNIFKHFINEKTQSRMRVFSDRSTWIPELLCIVDASILPKHWGGEKVDPDGNPKCPSVIPNGFVPKYYYLDNNIRSEEIEDDMVSILVNRGSTVELSYAVATTNSKLKYCFWSEDRDIGFGINFTSSDKSSLKKEILPIKRVDSHQELQKGKILCENTGTYIVVFDNIYSHFRSKQVHYSIKVVEENNEKECD